jgi:hypothetical protein
MLSCRLPHWMNPNVFGCMLWVFGGLLGTQSLACAQNTQKAGLTSQSTQVEEIYSARSVRESRVAPTEFCAQAKTGFNSASEDQFTFRSTATRAYDGRMLDTNVKTIGSIHACFGQTTNPAIINFYGDIRLGRTAFKGIGECRRMKSDFPERGLNVFNCFLDLSGLPGQYVGGLLTTNSITSLKSLGTETDPRGYTQSSIATIRLWKKRAER